MDVDAGGVDAGAGADVPDSEASDGHAVDADAGDSDGGHSTRVAPPGELAGEDGEDEGVDATTPPPVVEEYEVKVEGQIRKVSIDELKRGYSANSVATKRFQEAAKIRQEAQETLGRVEHALMTNPAAVLQQLGPQGVESAILGLLESPDPHVQAAITRAAEAMRAPPEVKRQRQLEREIEALREERESMMTRQEQQQLASITASVKQQFTALAAGALKSVGVPTNDATVRELAAMYQQTYPNGDTISEETMAQAAAKLANERLPMVTEAYLQSLAPEKLAALLGDERIKGLTQTQIAKVKAAQSAPAAGVSPKPRPKNNNTAPRLSLDELRDMRAMERLKGR